MLLAEHLTTFCDEQLSCDCQTFNSVNFMLSLFITTAKKLDVCHSLLKCWTWIEVFSCASTYILKLHGLPYSLHVQTAVYMYNCQHVKL